MSTTITVSFADARISASVTTINGQPNSPVEVTWATGTGVSVIHEITTPTAADGSTLNTPSQTGGVWSFTDQLGDTSKTYSYTITIFNTEATTITQDPQIVNNPSTL